MTQLIRSAHHRNPHIDGERAGRTTTVCGNCLACMTSIRTISAVCRIKATVMTSLLRAVAGSLQPSLAKAFGSGWVLAGSARALSTGQTTLTGVQPPRRDIIEGMGGAASSFFFPKRHMRLLFGVLHPVQAIRYHAFITLVRNTTVLRMLLPFLSGMRALCGAASCSQHSSIARP